MVLGETLKAHARRKLRKAKRRMVDVTVMTLRAELAAQFTIRANTTVRTLISLVGDELDHPWSRVRLIVGNKELPGSRTLYELGVRTDLVCTVLLMPRLFTVYCTCRYTPKGYMLRLDPSTTIDNVKAEIHQRLDLPVDQQRLIFRGQPLEDSTTLLENEITDGACIFLEVMWPLGIGALRHGRVFQERLED